VTSALWRGTGHTAARACLATGIGLWLSSLSEFIALELNGGLAATLASDLLILTAAGALYLSRRRSEPSPVANAPSPPARADRRLLFALGAAATAGALGLGAFAVLQQISVPQGDWDAWAIWNLKARFFARGGPLWSRAFDDSLAWSHPDYPLFLSTTVARLWVYAGGETALIPGFVALLFAGLTAVALAAFLAARQGVATGLLAALALLATPDFMAHSAHQIADLPLGYWLLLALGVLSLTERDGVSTNGACLLAGLCSGAAAWTKNEGSLLLLAVLAAVGARDRMLARCRAFLAGAAFPLSALAVMKLSLSAQSDLVAGQSLSRVGGRLVDPARHADIIASFAHAFWQMTGGTVLVTLLVLAPLLGPNRDGEARRVARSGALVLAIVLCGYYAVYLGTPHDLGLHLRLSNRRLFMQLWPSALFVLFSWLTPLAHPPASPRSSPPARTSPSFPRILLQTSVCRLPRSLSGSARRARSRRFSISTNTENPIAK
jgi:hypothetical protein